MCFAKVHALGGASVTGGETRWELTMDQAGSSTCVNSSSPRDNPMGTMVPISQVEKLRHGEGQLPRVTQKEGAELTPDVLRGRRCHPTDRFSRLLQSREEMLASVLACSQSAKFLVPVLSKLC